MKKYINIKLKNGYTVSVDGDIELINGGVRIDNIVKIKNRYYHDISFYPNDTIKSVRYRTEFDKYMEQLDEKFEVNHSWGVKHDD